MSNNIINPQAIPPWMPAYPTMYEAFKTYRWWQNHNALQDALAAEMEDMVKVYLQIIFMPNVSEFEISQWNINKEMMTALSEYLSNAAACARCMYVLSATACLACTAWVPFYFGALTYLIGVAGNILRVGNILIKQLCYENQKPNWLTGIYPHAMLDENIIFFEDYDD